MKGRPILFSDEMVRAILDGRKTQTRRIVKLRAHDGLQADHNPWRYCEVHRDGRHFWQHRSDIRRMIVERCPYGVVGDRLWVRECWQHGDSPTRPIVYRATDKNSVPPLRWKPSIFLRRGDSRLTLEITDVRVQRLQDITAEDAIKEGTRCWICGGRVDGTSENDCGCFHSKSEAVPSYSVLWSEINGEGSWAANPWVWALTFKRVQP